MHLPGLFSAILVILFSHCYVIFCSWTLLGISDYLARIARSSVMSTIETSSPILPMHFQQSDALTNTFIDIIFLCSGSGIIVMDLQLILKVCFGIVWCLICIVFRFVTSFGIHLMSLWTLSRMYQCWLLQTLSSDVSIISISCHYRLLEKPVYILPF